MILAFAFLEDNFQKAIIGHNFSRYQMSHYFNSRPMCTVISVCPENNMIHRYTLAYQFIIYSNMYWITFIQKRVSEVNWKVICKLKQYVIKLKL